jgi:hypothetical protein
LFAFAVNCGANLTPELEYDYLLPGMTRQGAKLFHGMAAFGLLACAACPAVEFLCRSNDCIFLSGHDTETSLALLVLLVELAVASLKFAITLLPGVFLRLADALHVDRIALGSWASLVVAEAASPPLALRI